MSPYYLLLKRYGFSPAKAGEIALDAARNDKYARKMVKLADAALSHKEGSKHG